MNRLVGKTGRIETEQLSVGKRETDLERLSTMHMGIQYNVTHPTAKGRLYPGQVACIPITLQLQKVTGAEARVRPGLPGKTIGKTVAMIHLGNSNAVNKITVQGRDSQL